METKSLRVEVEVKDADKGQVTAVFSTFNDIDSDGDVTLPGAFEDGAMMAISAFGHKSWDGALPVGTGVIRTTETEAIADLQFFMDTKDGHDTFVVVKGMGKLQQWSYGFDTLKYSFGEFQGEQVRFLEKNLVHEVSPVLLGAGNNTRTLTAKSSGGPVSRRKQGVIAVHDTEVVARSWDGHAAVKALADDAKPSELRSVHAWVDPDGDPEAKSSYLFAHHHGAGGPANLRACLTGIAVLNGARGATVPDADRKGVYDHLAAHVREADRVPPELSSTPDGTTKSFNDELLGGLAGLSNLVDSATRVVALRAEKGKQLSRVNTEVLDWIADDLKRLQVLIANPPADTVPDDELNSLFLASLSRIHDL